MASPDVSVNLEKIDTNILIIKLNNSEIKSADLYNMLLKVNQFIIGVIWEFRGWDIFKIFRLILFYCLFIPIIFTNCKINYYNSISMNRFCMQLFIIEFKFNTYISYYLLQYYSDLQTTQQQSTLDTYYTHAQQNVTYTCPLFIVTL